MIGTNMSTPADKLPAATPGSDNKDSQEKDSGDVVLTFDQKVNQIIDSSEADENGNIILPDDVPEDLKFASRAEKRRRDTQSALAKTTSANAVLTSEVEGLTKLVKEGKVIHISPEEEEELKELKFSDPEAWRERMNKLEQNATEAMQGNLTKISDDAQLMGATGERKVLLDAFISDNPGLTITDDVLANDIPPRITSALENGEVSFIEFLGNVKEYLETGKVILDNKPGSTPNLSQIGGNDVPGNEAEKQGDETDYEKQMF